MITFLTRIANATEKTVVDYDKGVRVTIRELDLVEVASGEGGCGYATKAGHYYAARIQKIKNGKPFGATQPERFYSSESERSAAIAKRLRQPTQPALSPLIGALLALIQFGDL